MTNPLLVTRTKRTVDVLRGAPGNERAVVASCAEPPRGVQLWDWDIEQQRVSKKNTLVYVADILSCRRRELGLGNRGWQDVPIHGIS